MAAAAEPAAAERSVSATATGGTTQAAGDVHILCGATHNVGGYLQVGTKF